MIANSLSHRGPDDISTFKNERVQMHFNRLKINDLSDNGNQPISFNNVRLICNGEIFNHKELAIFHHFNTVSESDCEVIIHMYLYLKNKYDNIYQIIDLLCNSIDGEFSFCLYDELQDFVICARDPFGVRPLFMTQKLSLLLPNLKLL
jgi:asparagine synthase (glutamine-hydrolysing)